MKTKYLQHLAILSTSALLFPLGALARDYAHSVDISSVVQIGSTHLKPGNYKVAWQGTGPAVTGEFPAEREDCGHGAGHVEDE
jgi:hypothetical protein